MENKHSRGFESRHTGDSGNGSDNAGEEDSGSDTEETDSDAPNNDDTDDNDTINGYRMDSFKLGSNVRLLATGNIAQLCGPLTTHTWLSACERNLTSMSVLCSSTCALH